MSRWSVRSPGPSRRLRAYDPTGAPPTVTVHNASFVPETEDDGDHSMPARTDRDTAATDADAGDDAEDGDGTATPVPEGTGPTVTTTGGSGPGVGIVAGLLGELALGYRRRG